MNITSRFLLINNRIKRKIILRKRKKIWSKIEDELNSTNKSEKD